MDQVNSLLIQTSLYATFMAWVSMPTLYTTKTNLAETVHQCCTEIYNNPLFCQTQFVKTFGAGISFSSINELCNTTLKDAGAKLLPQLYANLFVGMAETAIAVTMIALTAITLYKMFKGLPEAQPTDNIKTLKIGTLALSTVGFFILACWIIIPLTAQKSQANDAYNACCTANALSSSCFKAIEIAYGSGASISNLPDLCGSGLRLRQEESSHALNVLYTYIACAAIGYFITIAATGYKIYKKNEEITSSSPLLQTNDLNNIIDIIQ